MPYIQIPALPPVISLNGTEQFEVVQGGVSSRATTLQLAALATGQSVPFPISIGGTGATTAAGARTNLGLGTMAVQDASAVAITGGTVSGVSLTLDSLDNTPVGAVTPSTGAFTTLSATTPLSVSSGGTGQASNWTQWGAIYASTTGVLSSTAAGITGQILVGNTGAAPTWGAATGVAVTSLSFGTTGLTPNSATTGDVVVAGTLAVGNGGTGITSFGTGIATALGTNVNGSGAISLTTNAVFVTPTLGVASATTINKVTLTAPATGSTLTILDGKTLTVNKTLTLTGTDGTTMTFPSTSATIARTDASNSFTGAQTITNSTGTSGAQGINLNVTQTAPNAGDTSDSALALNYTLTASSATNELVTRALAFSATNNLTGGGAISNLRAFNIALNNNAGTITTTQAGVYIQQGTASGTVGTSYGIYVAAGQIGTTKYAFYDAGQNGAYFGATQVTTINKVTLTAPATGSTLTILDGKTLTVNNTMILAAGADGQTWTFPSTSGTVATLNQANTFVLGQTIADTRTSVSSSVSALTITTASGVNQGINYTANGTGTLTGGYTQDFNQFVIASDNINAAAGFVTGLNIDHHFGGSSMQGGREAFAANAYLSAASSGSNTNRNYVAVTGNAIAQSADTGTNPSASGTSAGAIFGGGFVGVAQNGATALLNVTGAEFNVAMQTGSTVFAKSLAQFSGRTDDAVSGTVVDSMLWLYNQGASAKWKDGMLFDGTNGTWPLNATTGTVLRTAGSGSALNGVDLSATTFSGSAFKSTGFSVDGLGNISGLKAALGSTGTSGNLGISLSSTQTSPNAGDTGDTVAAFTYTLSASSATNELVQRVFLLTAVNNLTGGGHAQSMRGVDVVLNTNSGATTENQFGVYIEGNNAGTVTTSYGVFVSNSLPGSTKWGFYDQGQNGAYFGATQATSLTVAAGTTSIAPLKLTSGTNLTTATAGVFEYDGSVTYFSPATSTRSTISAEQIMYLGTAYTLTNATGVQKLFNGSTNGQVTLPVGDYQFECYANISALPITGTYGFAMAGTATYTQSWVADAQRVAAGTAGASTTSFNTTANTAVTPTSATTTGYMRIRGTINVTVTGTVIPQFSMTTTAAAAVIGVGSYFKISPFNGINGATNVVIGNWS